MFNSDQFFNIAIVVLIGISFTFIYLVKPKKNPKIISMFFLGLLCSAGSVIVVLILGGDIINMMTLHSDSDDMGFGRSYVGGLGIILASILIGILSFIRVLVSKITGNFS